MEGNGSEGNPQTSSQLRGVRLLPPPSAWVPLEVRKAADANLIALPWSPGGDPTRHQRWEGRLWAPLITTELSLRIPQYRGSKVKNA